ncbi:MAG: flagellar biosynthesis protein FliQ [Methylophilaceae bacterium]|uniref:flagellar biosynthesis protein FliQ n=1 Tax=Methylovorus sp. MM2 TaxID=1848038 RepID=UPI0007E229A1|nr:flagellar biosynthesis protein FliQ [Methylovorus sp. MM2]OAM51267.1 EscS/YscS/HrcS family type III secretion system export apparatus protein [Methylovorus sp. MM2]
MTPEGVMTLGHQAMEVTLMVAAPMLIVVLLIGLIVSIFQAATQINEATLSFIPKLIGVFVVLVIAGPWMLTTMTDYMRLVFTSVPMMAAG